MNIQKVTMQDIYNRDLSRTKVQKSTYLMIKDLKTGNVYKTLKDAMKDLKISRTLFYYYLDKKTGKASFKNTILEIVNQ